MNRCNNIFKNILCLIIAILVSFMELQFFDGEYSIIIGIIIFTLTIPTIYLYFLPKHETMIIFLYCIILVYLLDFLGKDINIYLFLASLFTIIILFTHSLYTTNAIATKLKKPKYFIYVVILSGILLLVSLFSFLIYEYILKPNVNEQNKLALVYESVDSRQEDISDIKEEEINSSSGGGGGGGGSKIEEPIDIVRILKYLLILLLLILVIYIICKYLKHRLWLRKTLKLSKKEQVIEFYKYFLRTLLVLGLGIENGQTALEYMEISKNENFPYEGGRFINLSRLFMETKYGNRDIGEDDYEEILNYFYSISRSIRKKFGLRNYIFSYLFKI